MLVRIDHRPKRAPAFEPRIEVETQLPGHREIGALPGAHHDAIDWRECAARWVGYRHPAAMLFDTLDGKAPEQVQFAAVNEPLELVTERPARGQLVSSAAAKYARQIGSSNRPNDLRSCIRCGEARQIEQDVCGRMPAPDDQHALPGIRLAIAAKHIRDAGGDPVS